MSSEEKAPSQNPDDGQADAGIEPVEAELADPTPLAELAADSGSDESEGPSDAEVIVAQAADVAGDDKAGNRFFEDREATPDATPDAMPGGAGVAMAAVGKIPLKIAPPPLAKNLENLSANGGAVGALVLGIWCFLGSFITNWSIINGMLGLLLGAWGLTSRRKKTAWIGIALCTVGILLCLAEFSELINQWWYEVDDTVVG